MQPSNSSLVATTLLISLCAAIFGCSSTDDQAGLAALRKEVQSLSKKIDELRFALNQPPAPNDPRLLEQAVGTIDEADVIETHTLSDAKKRISELGDNPSSLNLAIALEEVGLWVMPPEEEENFQAFREETAQRLRASIARESKELHREALSAATGDEAARLHSQAGQVISLFPLSEQSEVLEQARILSTQQADIATRAQSLRRQRYNLWATGQIEKAINGYYENSKTLSPIAENESLVHSCAEHLAVIDPILLEPGVLELYSYVLSLTNHAIAEPDRVKLAKALSNSKTKRRTLGDF